MGRGGGGLGGGVKEGTVRPLVGKGEKEGEQLKGRTTRAGATSFNEKPKNNSRR